MKKFVLFLIIAVFGTGVQGVSVFAQDTNKDIKQYTTEKVPGLNCTCVINKETFKADGTSNKDEKLWWSTCSGSIEKRLYVCTQETGLSGFMSLFKKMMNWVVQIATLLGVLAIAALGVAWAVAGGDDPEYKKTLKDWVIGIMIGLVILFMFSYILRFLAPWIFE